MNFSKPFSLLLITFFVLRKIINTQKTLSIIVHPREDKIFAHSIDIIKCFDIATGIAIQTFDVKYHESERYKFTISPCGTFIFTTYQYKIIAWSLYSSAQQYIYNLTNYDNSKNFISSMNFHPNGMILSVTMYGEDGLVYLLSHSGSIDLDNMLYTVDNKNEFRRKSDNDSTIPNKCTSSVVENTKLSDIIRRVDEIFTFGSAQINQTDDNKVTEKNQISTLILPASIGNLADELQSSEDEDCDDSNSNKTFTVAKQSSVSSDNRTFNVSNSVENGGTYNVEIDININPSINPDDTDISESM